MRRDWVMHLLLAAALDLAHAAGTSQGAGQELQALLLEGGCPRFLLPHECTRLHALVRQPDRREAVLAEYREIQREREQACRCEPEARSTLSVSDR